MAAPATHLAQVAGGPQAAVRGAAQQSSTALQHVATSSELAQLLFAFAVVLGAAFGLAIHLQGFLEDKDFEGVLISSGLRRAIRDSLPGGLNFSDLFLRMGVTCLAAWLVGGTVFALVSWTSWSAMLVRWGLRFAWLWTFGAYEIVWGLSGAVLPGDAAWLATLVNALPFVHMLAWAGFFAGAPAVLFPADRGAGLRRALAHPVMVWATAAAYALVFATLSILQYRALMVPHGDTAMYEEHLWNLLHGKGFRSQLDSGRLFFGEHLEVIHVLLVPIYVLFPSLPTLNVCLTVGLASGAIAVRGIARRLGGSDAAANWLALAYLLYFPLQYLNLEASLKTFRPENLAVPLLLFALWALEANRFRTMLALMGVALLAKEDYAIVTGMIGLYLGVRRSAPSRNAHRLGLATFVVSVAYLWFVLNVFIPYFRGGPPHYMSYYPDELGKTPLELVVNSLRRPGVLFDHMATASNLIFVLVLIVPLAGLPLLGIGRLWVLGPTLFTLLLIQLPDARSPFFHFHAPLVPVLFWAAAEGLKRMRIADCGLRNQRVAMPNDQVNQQFAIRNPQSGITRFARFAAACCFTSGLFFGKSPLSIGFFDWNTNMRSYGRMLYVPGPNSPERMRKQSFEELFPLIPLDARVAATDFVRPRFTHHRECHQYGEGGLKPHVLADSIDFIVVDLWGPFSNPAQGLRLNEVDEQPDRWSVFYVDPFFFVVRAKRDGEDRPAAADDAQSETNRRTNAVPARSGSGPSS